MRNKIKTSGVNQRDPWLAIWARKLRNWLDAYLSEDAVHSPKREAMPPDQEESAVRSHPKDVSAAMEHWRELARKAAPEFLASEEPADPQPGPGEIPSQATEEAQEGTLQERVAQEPESTPAAASSYPASKAPSAHQQTWSAAPQVDHATKSESAAPRPLVKLRTSRDIEETSKPEALRKEVGFSYVSQQIQISDAQSSRAFPSDADINEKLQTRSVKKQNVEEESKETQVQKMTVAAPAESSRLRKTVDRGLALFTGRHQKEAADWTPEIPVELDFAAPPISFPAAESQHAGRKQIASDQLPAGSSAGKVVRNEAGFPPAVLEWKRTACKTATHAQLPVEKARPERTRQPRVTEATTTPSNTDSFRASAPQADLWLDRSETDPWPELPEDMSVSSPDWMESLSSREHIYALDAEQQGGS